MAERLDYGRIILRDEGKEEERSESGLPNMQVQDPSIEKRLNSEMLKKTEKEVKAENGKPAKTEMEVIEKQKKAGTREDGEETEEATGAGREKKYGD